MSSQEMVLQSLDLLDAIQDYAYETGFHECGYDPVSTLRGEFASLEAEVERNKQWREANARAVEVLLARAMKAEAEVARLKKLVILCRVQSCLG